METFFEIPNFPRYEINKKCEVRNKETKRVLKPATKKGYLCVVLSSENNKPKQMFLHRLLMITFNPVDNMENLKVDHLNNIKTENVLSNLEWVTNKENTHRAIKNGLYKNRRTVISDEVVEKIRKEYVPGINGNYKQLLEKYNIKKSMFYYIINDSYRKDSESTFDVNPLVKKKTTKCSGSDSGISKLTEQQVLEIKELLKINKLTQKEIGEKYNVSHENISNIKLGKSWVHVK